MTPDMRHWSVSLAPNQSLVTNPRQGGESFRLFNNDPSPGEEEKYLPMSLKEKMAS